jgi:hypothetical protein
MKPVRVQDPSEFCWTLETFPETVVRSVSDFQDSDIATLEEVPDLLRADTLTSSGGWEHPEIDCPFESLVVGKGRHRVPIDEETVAQIRC